MPRHIQDDEHSRQDGFSCSSTHHGHGAPNGMASWAVSDAEVLENISSTNPESPEVQLLSFSLSQQLMPSTVGPSEVMYQTGSDFPAAPDMGGHHDLDFTQSHDFHQYSSLVDFAAFDNDACTSSGTQSRTPDDAHTDDSHLAVSNETWNSMMPDNRRYHGSTLDQFSSNLFQPLPASPPLTEAGTDGSVTSACSHTGYPAFMAHDDTLMKDVTATSIGPMNPGDPLFPLSPPLTEKDRNRYEPKRFARSHLIKYVADDRTVRPSKHARRSALQATGSQFKVKEQQLFPPLPARETIKPRSKDTELRNPRDHPYYSLPAQNDGKYYCPFTSGDKPCNHPPTTQKCAYQ